MRRSPGKFVEEESCECLVFILDFLIREECSTLYWLYLIKSPSCWTEIIKNVKDDDAFMQQEFVYEAKSIL